MILSICIFVVIFVLIKNPNSGEMFKKKEGVLTINIHNILFIPCAIYIIYFLLNYFNII